MEYETRRIVREIKSEIAYANIPEIEKFNLLSKIARLEEIKLNIMITGATGSGKSSTINTLFNEEVSEIGTGVDPETMDIQEFERDHFIVWDTPGLGDGIAKDAEHARKITDKLSEKDDEGNTLIDLVIVVVDGSSRDLGTTYELINCVIVPVLGDQKESKLLIAINKADMAMSGRHWSYDRNEPDATMIDFLDRKAASVSDRIQEATGIKTYPVYYSAGYKEDGEEQKPYHLAELWKHIFESTPLDKRIIAADIMRRNQEIWIDELSAMISRCISYAKWENGIFGRFSSAIHDFLHSFT